MIVGLVTVLHAEVEELDIEVDIGENQLKTPQAAQEGELVLFLVSYVPLPRFGCSCFYSFLVAPVAEYARKPKHKDDNPLSMRLSSNAHEQNCDFLKKIGAGSFLVGKSMVAAGRRVAAAETVPALAARFVHLTLVEHHRLE